MENVTLQKQLSLLFLQIDLYTQGFGVHCRSWGYHGATRWVHPVAFRGIQWPTGYLGFQFLLVILAIFFYFPPSERR